jgi:hypothetical protein
MKKNRIISIVLLVIFAMAASAWADTVSVRPYGIATPKWYSYSDGEKSDYYLEHPTLSTNDQVVTEDATQIMTNKTLTSPTISGPTLSNFLLPAEDTTATNILTASESGKVIWLNSDTEFVTTLPALSTVSAGTRFKFIVKAAPASADYTVITGNSLENKIYGLAVVNGASVPAADEDTITFADGVAVVGDWVEVVSDGTNWYVSGQGHAAGAITLTAAD